jgi:thiol-disulfide isomerase/thioredoxin
MIQDMKRRTLIIGAAGLASMLTVGWLGWRESARRAPQANRGATAIVRPEPQPDAFFRASLPDLEGSSQALSQWRGQPLVINFWATWCPPCVKEIPDLNELAGKHPSAVFVGVAVDTAENVRKFIQSIPIHYPVVIAGHQGIELVRELGNTAGGLPFTVLIRADGSVQEVIMGIVDPKQLDQQIDRLVAISAK